MIQSFAIAFASDGTPTDQFPEGTAFSACILSLPFRVRRPGLIKFELGGEHAVYIRNKMDVPPDMAESDFNKLLWNDGRLRDWEDFYSEALILAPIAEKHGPSPAEVWDAAVGVTGSSKPEMPGRLSEGLNDLNDIIVAYHYGSGCLFGGAVVRRLLFPEYMDRLRFVHSVFVEDGYELSEADVLAIFDARGSREFRSRSGVFSTQTLADLDPDPIASATEYLARHREHVFYQFAMDAKADMVRQDHMTALLKAVVAMEGVAIALLRQRFRTRAIQVADSTVADPASASGLDRQSLQAVEDLSTRLGFSLLLQHLNALVLPTAERVPDDLLNSALTAITYRNEIMHSIYKRGQYRSRLRSNSDLSKAYSSAIKVFEHFRGLVERTPSDGSPA